ncbi:PR-1-like protein [Thozetella sp. PMI_491]|nr:PR-1-like protein [Thozetella sp. PMI_491]
MKFATAAAFALAASFVSSAPTEADQHQTVGDPVFAAGNEIYAPVRRDIDEDNRARLARRASAGASSCGAAVKTTSTPKPSSTGPQPTVGPNPPSPPGIPSQADIQSALKVHNDARAAHGEKPLVWDTGLVAKAQVWANQLAIDNYLHHDTSGENLYERWPPTNTDFTYAAKAWVAEQPYYKPGTPIPNTSPQGNFSQYGHYTQCIWSTTQRLGMALTRDNRGKVWVVARYDPVGNWVGMTPY